MVVRTVGLVLDGLEVLEGLFYRSFLVASDDVGCFDHAVVTRGSLLKAIHIFYDALMC